MIRRKAALAAAALLVGGLAGVSQASTVISFDADGAGGDAAVLVDTFDFQPGNVLAKDVVAAIASPGTKVKFTEYYQASLGSLLLSGSDVSPAGLGAPAGYEITAVVKHSGYATLVGTTLLLDYAYSADGVLQLWAGPIDAVDDTGVGFNNGTKILEADVVGFTGSFRLSGGPVTLDQHIVTGDSYPGVTTVVGTGSYAVTGATSFFDASYFLSAPKTFSLVFADGFSNLPFRGVEPTDAMFDGTIPAIGAVNGVPAGGGADVLLESDARATFEVPLPASVWGGLVGLVGLAACRRSRK